MNFSIVKTLMKKELKEYFRNQSTLTMFIISIGMVTMMGVSGGGSLIMTIIMPMTFLGLYVPGFLIAEEKERRTLGALLVSPATATEIIFGKLLVSATITFLVVYTLVLSLHLEEVGFLSSFLALLATTFFLTFIGAIIGLISPSQALVNTIGTFLMLIFMLAELLQPLSSKVSVLARALPTHQAIQGLIYSQTALTEKTLIYTATSAIFLIAIFTCLRAFLSEAGRQESEKWTWNNRQKSALAVLFGIMIGTSVFLNPKQTKFLEQKIENSELKFNLQAARSDWQTEETWHGNKYSLDLTNLEDKSHKVKFSVIAKKRGKTLETLKEDIAKKDAKDKEMKIETFEIAELEERTFLKRKFRFKGKTFFRLITESNGYFYTLGTHSETEEDLPKKVEAIERMARTLVL